MNHYLDFAKELSLILSKEDIKLDEPMKKHTSFKVGGPADILVTPKNIDELIKVIRSCKESKVPYFIVGFGSNLLVKDGGIRGVVIKLSNFSNIDIKDNVIKVQCGASLAKTAREALKHSLSGLEFACGIPGTVGGAVAMNAGAYGGEMKDVLCNVTILDHDGNVKILSHDELELGYRTSAVLKNQYIALECEMNLKNGEYDEIKKTIDDLMGRRAEKQPLEYPSAGSTFKRPVGYFAGKLIEDSNLKGKTIGGASVSEKHSGFIINKNQATAKDILDLISHVQEIVKKEFDVVLETEVRIIGEDI